MSFTHFAFGAAAVPMPADDSRWRCSLCGNLPRFDVVANTRTREYVHVDLAGHPTVAEREVLARTERSVTCRWCAAGDSVVLEPRPHPPAEP